MKKIETIKIAGWLALVVCTLAGIFTYDFASYFLQILFSGVVLLHAYGKLKARTFIIVGTILLLIVRIFGFSELYDLIDIGIWGTILYSVL